MATGKWFSAHTHSRYSKLDGMSDVGKMVKAAADMGQPAFGLTDHGSMAGAIQLYNACDEYSMAAFPGFEGYLLDPSATLEDKHAGRYHFGLLALDFKGYQALTRVMSLSHTRPRFNRFPRLTIEDLAELGDEAGDNIAFTTGCFFGYVQQSLVEQGPDVAKRAIQMFAQWFPNLYVEVQHHNITHSETWDDTLVVDALATIAYDMGLPLLATQDSHYTHEHERDAHALMKRMVYGGSDDEFPGDSFHLADEDWVAKHYDPDIWEQALEGSVDLLDKSNLEMPALDKYKPHIPSSGEDHPQARLRVLCMAALLKKFGDVMAKDYDRYYQRTMRELKVIEQLGMAAYFLLSKKHVIDWCKSENIFVEARGSANGSIVCYWLGITQVDPIYWGTSFDRFLAIDRIGPPDIDFDVEDAHRDDVVRHLDETFDAIRIGTWSQLGVREEDGQGSVVVSWVAGMRRIAKEAGVPFTHNWVKTIRDVAQVSRTDAKNLQVLSDMNSVTKSYGVHASGVLLAGSDMPIEAYVPKMLVASSNTLVSQFDQDDVEKLGLLKLDILGQATLTVMRICQELMGKDDPTDFSWIPYDDPEACKLLREGRTDNGIFHFEGYTKAKGGKEMGIRSTMDTVLAQGLFMPGAMDIAPGQHVSQKDLYIQRRKDPQARKKITYLHPAFEKALKQTYGAVIFQEQVIDILRGLGMDIVGINKFFKVVKDSGKGSGSRNAQRIREVRQSFDKACKDNKLDPDEVWSYLAAFVSYGFNRNHATGYGIRSYRCAYLKAHYPLEFMTGLLTAWSGRDKEKVYAREARRIGIRILPPVVNVSGALWTLDRQRGAIRRGLLSIPRVGLGAARSIERGMPFFDVMDLIERTDSRAVTGAGSKGKPWDGNPEHLTGTLQALYDIGALQPLLDEEEEN